MVPLACVGSFLGWRLRHLRVLATGAAFGCGPDPRDSEAETSPEPESGLCDTSSVPRCAGGRCERGETIWTHTVQSMACAPHAVDDGGGLYVAFGDVAYASGTQIDHLDCSGDGTSIWGTPVAAPRPYILDLLGSADAGALVVGDDVGTPHVVWQRLTSGAEFEAVGSDGVSDSGWITDFDSDVSDAVWLVVDPAGDGPSTISRLPAGSEPVRSLPLPPGRIWRLAVGDLDFVVAARQGTIVAVNARAEMLWSSELPPTPSDSFSPIAVMATPAEARVLFAAADGSGLRAVRFGRDGLRLSDDPLNLPIGRDSDSYLISGAITSSGDTVALLSEEQTLSPEGRPEVGFHSSVRVAVFDLRGDLEWSRRYTPPDASDAYVSACHLAVAPDDSILASVFTNNSGKKPNTVDLHRLAP